jgi:ribose transport system substrate-binding protein
VADGIVAEAPAFTTAENQATEQAAQIQNMILEGYDAIVLNAASPTALNGAVAEACDAGIVGRELRRHRDGALRLPHRRGLPRDGPRPVEYLAQRLPEGGNLLEIRGLAGVFVDDEISAASTRGVEEFPQFSIAGSVHGDWAQDVAQRAGRGHPAQLAGRHRGRGDARAATATARPRPSRRPGREVPVIIMGNRQDELAWWKEQRDASGYETMSCPFAPGVSTLAFWVAQQVLDGQTVPQDLIVPFLEIQQDGLDAALRPRPRGRGNVEYTLEDAQR